MIRIVLLLIILGLPALSGAALDVGVVVQEQVEGHTLFQIRVQKVGRRRAGHPLVDEMVLGLLLGPGAEPPRGTQGFQEGDGVGVTRSSQAYIVSPGSLPTSGIVSSAARSVSFPKRRSIVHA